MDIGTAVGVAIYVETVYRLPGLGWLTIRAIGGDPGFDLPVIVAVVLLVGTAIILLNLVADIVVAALDPRVDIAGARRAHATGGIV
jgi:peptide/nickel transport system permease protein